MKTRLLFIAMFLFFSSGVFAQGLWTQKANLPAPASGRINACGFSIGNKGYIGFGDAGSSYINDLWEYDSLSNTWSQKASLSLSINNALFGAFTIGNKAFILMDSFNFWEWDQLSNTWTKRVKYAGQGGSPFFAFSIGTKGYIYQPQTTPTFYEWDTLTNVWTKKGTPPFYYDNTVAFAIGSKGYIGTGGQPVGSMSGFWEYDPGTDTWTQKASLGPKWRGSAIGFSIGLKGYIGLGRDSQGSFLDLWEYDAVTGVWEQKANFPGVKHDKGRGFAIGNMGYIGTGGNYLNDLWKFDPSVCTIIASYYVTKTNLFIGDTLNFKNLANAPASFQWKINGALFSTALDTNYKFNVPGTYTITLIAKNGACIDSISKIITVSQKYWTQKANFGGTSREFAISFSIGTKGYVGTGDKAGTYYKDFWEYNQTTNTWAQKAMFGGAARHAAAAFAIGTKGYVAGGADASTLYQDTWEWDQATNVWTQKVNMPKQRSQAVGFTINGKGYVGTGLTNTFPTILDDFWQYDPTANTWTQKTTFPGGTRTEAVGVAIGTKGYIGIGRNGFGPSYQDWYEYDPTANAWTKKADFAGAARYGATAFVIGTNGYVGTGNTSASSETKDFWLWNQSTNTWGQMQDLTGVARYYSSAFAIGSLGYVSTGYDGSNYLFDLWEFNPLNTEVNELSIAENGFVIYPNPINSSATLQLNTQMKNAEVVIYNIQGKEMMRKKLSGDKMEIEKGSLVSGIYFVQVRDEERQWVEKIIVE